jgi:hypothetical protein
MELVLIGLRWHACESKIGLRLGLEKGKTKKLVMWS